MLIYLHKEEGRPMPVAVPRLTVPFGTGLHPATDAARAATDRWAREFGLTARPELRARLNATAPARLAGRISPNATREGLQFNADWAAWLFLFDDEYCDESELGADPAGTVEMTVWMFGALEHGVATRHDTFAFALADLRSRLTVLATPVQRARFLGAATTYLYALAWEAVHRQRRVPAEFGEYVRMRRHSGAVATCLALIDVANGFELTEAQWCSPELRAASDAVSDIICWSNDIVSFGREESQSLEVLSLPTVLARTFGLTLQEALNRCAAMVRARLADYYTAERPLLASGNPGLIRFAADLRHWIAGNLEWSYETDRYKVTA
jgi:Terpene synthase family 2, C-terminal metal binding